MKKSKPEPIPVMDYRQYRRARRLVHECCNYDGGNCIALDDGGECVCVQSIRKTAIKDCAAKLKALQTQTDQLKNGKLRLYEKYTSGSISKAEYLKQKTAFDENLAENAEAIQKAHERMQELDSECSCSDERVNQVCEQYRNQTALTFELTHAFIKAIYVHDADNIEILWKFRDIYEDTEGKK